MRTAASRLFRPFPLARMRATIPAASTSQDRYPTRSNATRIVPEFVQLPTRVIACAQLTPSADEGGNGRPPPILSAHPAIAETRV